MADYVKVAKVSDIPPGGRLITEADDGLWVAIFNVDGALYAIEDVCPHDEGPIGEGDLHNTYIIECPRHGQRFDIRDGSRQQLASTGDVPTFEVRVQGDDVLVRVDQ
ncbi:MAG: Rieske (2Fe-2S) protein [Chloroflexi bacterium]|nr:Rieske (2Fe-2S) protein [Chloroflexota bacterium]